MSLVWLGACASTPDHAGNARAAKHKVLVLEDRFSRFVSAPLDRDEDGAPLAERDVFVRIEEATNRLQGLRLSYLDVVQDADRPQERVLALVRLGELHLDLASRIRRVPYPRDASATERAAFDRALSRRAVALEATGLGVLTQLVHYAGRMSYEDRFVRRARAYLALHSGDRLDENMVATVRQELLQATMFPAPRRLLEPMRVGQRAARLDAPAP